MTQRTRATMAIVAIAAAATAAAVGPATASSGVPYDEISDGEVMTLPGGDDLGYDIAGAATLVRLVERTFVTVDIAGLEPDTTYPTHVHNAPCSADPAGGSHYQNVVDGDVDDVNEIWPIVTTDADGRGHGEAVHAHRARQDAMSIVIHYPEDTSVRLACVDLTAQDGAAAAVATSTWVETFDRVCLTVEAVVEASPDSWTDEEFVAFTNGAVTVMRTITPPADQADAVTELLDLLESSLQPGLSDEEIAEQDERALAILTDLGVSPECIGGVSD